MRDFIVTFTVTGRGTFPMDMLRHDVCCPADTTSAFNILEPDDLPTRRAPRSVTLRAQVKAVGPALAIARACTTERWRSFGWSVDASSVFATDVTPVR